MNLKYLVFGAVIIALLAGMPFAIGGANLTGDRNVFRWTGLAPDRNATQGGNITSINLTQSSLTTRWAAFYGNVSGNITLGNMTSYVYQWNYAISSLGTVCASTGSARNFVSPTNGVAADIDTDWTLGSSVDDAAHTFNNSNCTFTISTGTLTNTISADHAQNSTFWTCAITVDSDTAQDNYAFCASIQSAGKPYVYTSGTANYEIMVPATPGNVSETYYFYAELG